MASTTVDDPALPRARPQALSRPGLLLVHSAGRPRHVVMPLDGAGLAIGREELLARGVHDERVSRHHLEVSFAAGTWTIRDCGSRNGSFLDGQPLTGSFTGAAPRVARLGQVLLLFLADLAPSEDPGLEVRGELVLGPVLRGVHERVAALARACQGLLLTGESGTGKEVAARAYHQATGRGPFVAVNCATIPRELAERLLFGTRKGAYSGAVAEADGHVQAADGGTLFLDEIGELDPQVQAKLLRVLEAREVLALGATRPRSVDLRLCAATLRDLRQDVSAGRFREDLYFRVGQPEVRLPPLRERPEEIPWLIDSALRGLSRPLPAGPTLVERCLLLPWPGNVRELCTEVRAAALTVSACGQAVEAEHLSPTAGRPLRGEDRPDQSGPERSAEMSVEALRLREALCAERGNVSKAAEQLGVTRPKLRRLIEKYGIDVSALRAGRHRQPQGSR